MVFQFNDVNYNVRIITSIYRARFEKGHLIITESGIREGSEEHNLLLYKTPETAIKDLKKLVKMMNKYYEKQHNMEEKNVVGFGVDAKGCEVDDGEMLEDYYEED